jgi:hypothetical protein
MAETTPTNTFVQRLLGAVSLDVAIYEEVEADRGATGQALATVVLSSIAAGFGARGLGGATPANISFICVLSLSAWAVWAVMTYEIGGHMMPEPQTRVDVGELLRTIGFASAPGLLRVFGILPGVAVPAFAITAVWMLAATIVAVRQALDYESTGRAIIVCTIGWALVIVFAVGIGLLFGPTLY